jgi:hypothetical protein
MQRTDFSRPIRNSIVLIVVALSLGACLEKQETNTNLDAPVGQDVAADQELLGSVGDGPIVAAKMKIKRNDGALLAELESDASAGYNITIRTKGKYYPLSIDARGGIDLVTNLAPDFVLLGAVFEPGKKSVANISPFSTMAVEIARDLPGGLNKENLNEAQGYVVSSLSNGLSTLVATGPMNTAITKSNIAEVVKASETLGETVRRVRDLQQIFNRSSSADRVVQAMASDLIDGIVDGRGGSRIDARISAISTVVAAQVLLESMQNELHVNGQDATNLMNAAVDQVIGANLDVTIGDLTVTSKMLLATRVGLDACIAVLDLPELKTLRQAVDGVQAGMSPLLVRTLIPDDYRATMEAAALAVAGGDDAVINTVNDVSRNGGTEPDPANQAPTISGTPPTSVAVGSQYAFTPAADDPNGDALTFSISGKPTWASFSATTGKLSGTPGTADVGNHSNIVISVGDGELTSSLAAFTITVDLVNTAPTISGSPPGTVNANNQYSFTPTANDSDGDDLTFTVSGLPVWATFNASNGRISGTPGDGDVGTYSNILITVTDTSDASAALGPFSITVSAVSLGSVTLNWIPPTENDDGTTLMDLDGYRIYWGTTPGNYPNSVTIDNEGLTSYVVDNLAPGTYEFVATSFNVAGVESVYSSPATKVVN